MLLRAKKNKEIGFIKKRLINVFSVYVLSVIWEGVW